MKGLAQCLEKTLESPLDCKEIQPVHPKGNQSWVFIRRTDAEAETPILWPPHAKSWLIGKDPDAGRDWGLEEKGTTEDEMAGWHHQLDGREFEWTLGVGDGQGSLACCDSQGRKESDMTEQLNSTEKEKKGGNKMILWILMISNLLNSEEELELSLGTSDLPRTQREPFPDSPSSTSPWHKLQPHHVMTLVNRTLTVRISNLPLQSSSPL